VVHCQPDAVAETHICWHLGAVMLVLLSIALPTILVSCRIWKMFWYAEFHNPVAWQVCPHLEARFHLMCDIALHYPNTSITSSCPMAAPGRKRM
jgi:hypothetical protein